MPPPELSLDKGGHCCPPIKSILGVSVKPFPVLTGLRVATVCLCLLKSQTPFDGTTLPLKVRIIESNNFVGSHWIGLVCLVWYS